MEAFFPVPEKKHSTYLLALPSPPPPVPARAEPHLAAPGGTGDHRPAKRAARPRCGRTSPHARIWKRSFDSSPGEAGKGETTLRLLAPRPAERGLPGNGTTGSAETSSRVIWLQSRCNHTSAEAEMLLEGEGVGRQL